MQSADVAVGSSQTARRVLFGGARTSVGAWFVCLQVVMFAVMVLYLASGDLLPGGGTRHDVTIVPGQRVATMFAIWLNNFLVAAWAPLFIAAAAIANRSRAPRVAACLNAVALVACVRVPVLVGAFAGTNPGWLLGAPLVVWFAESFVLALACATVVASRRGTLQEFALLSRHRLMVAAIVLAASAVFEVYAF